MPTFVEVVKHVLSLIPALFTRAPLIHILNGLDEGIPFASNLYVLPLINFNVLASSPPILIAMSFTSVNV